MTSEEGATTDLVEDVTNDAATEAVSMDDTIRATLASISERGSKDSEPSSGKSRDESGKFARSVAEEEPAPEEVEPSELVAPVRQAPNTWKKEVSEKFASLPPEVQDEIERRENDFFRGIEQYKAHAHRAQAYDQVVNPYTDYLSKLGVDAPTAVGKLLHAEYTLRNGDAASKAQALAKLAQDYGIDIAEAQAVPQVDRNVSAIQQRVEQLEGFLQSQSKLENQRKEQEVNTELVKFAGDPAHKHFDAVRLHMASLIQDGLATDLKSAYEQAIFANPQTRAAILAEQQATERAESAKKAQAARKASSINIRPRASMSATEPIGSMEDTIRAELRRLTSA